tara:strand:+ start:3841 stop:4266 length:426 start_codon:yes stop_codon:yes gene_type:complete
MRIRKNGKVIRLTESDLISIKRKVLREEIDLKYFNKVVTLFMVDFKKNKIGFLMSLQNYLSPQTKDLHIKILKRIFKDLGYNDVLVDYVEGGLMIYDNTNKRLIYNERPNGYWQKTEYDNDNNIVSKKTSDDEIEKYDDDI